MYVSIYGYRSWDLKEIKNRKVVFLSMGLMECMWHKNNRKPKTECWLCVHWQLGGDTGSITEGTPKKARPNHVQWGGHVCGGDDAPHRWVIPPLTQRIHCGRWQPQGLGCPVTESDAQTMGPLHSFKETQEQQSVFTFWKLSDNSGRLKNGDRKSYRKQLGSINNRTAIQINRTRGWRDEQTQRRALEAGLAQQRTPAQWGQVCLRVWRTFTKSPLGERNLDLRGTSTQVLTSLERHKEVVTPS